LVECKNQDLDLDILNLVHIDCIGCQTIQFCKYILLAKTKSSTEIQVFTPKYYLETIIFKLLWWSLMVLNGPQRSSKILICPKRSSKVFKGPQRSSKALIGPQRSSKVLKEPQRSSKDL
jgi:hypothetical protein